VATNDGSTIIGETITVTGNVSGDEDLTVRGRIEGSIAIGKTLIVEQTGVVRAEVQAGNCVISGVVVGNIAASESVEITKEARMVGDISAPRVIIADGASFRGRVDMGDVNVEAAGEERPARLSQPARPALRPPSRPERPERPPARLPERLSREEEMADEEERSLPPSKPPAPPVPVGLGAVKRKVIVRRK
jgi:cytoskeletal protein CcmA (bactofilin family)